MSELKDPKIKLFGKTIELPENSAAAAAADEAGESGSAGSCEPAVGDSSNQDPPCSSDSMLEGSNFSSGDAGEQEPLEILSEQDHSNGETLSEPLTPKELKDSNTLSDSDASVKTSKTEEDQAETTSNNNPNEKTLKKPDKILPCPRCNSMDTKFCYFNNYNVNQPRHFCKNCQRYWTAGGTMRNVPVGAGRRKNKNSSVSQFRHLTVSEVLHQPNGIHQHPNGAILTFGSDATHCKPITSVLNIAENGPRKPEQLGIPVSHGIKENGDDVGNKTRLTEPMPVCNPFSYPGFHWPYPSNPVHWGPEISYPMPFYPTTPSYWGWNLPWIIPQAGPNPVLSATGPTNSPTLGKHSREDDNVGLKDELNEAMVRESNPKKCLWVPKTLRIDDPGEAAKSSIWATLGIKNDGVDCVGGGGLSKVFRTGTKSDEKAHVGETSTLIQANPPALSRSLSFHESS